jgi:ArsR family metal-binding transcriptional regulator
MTVAKNPMEIYRLLDRSNCRGVGGRIFDLDKCRVFLTDLMVTNNRQDAKSLQRGHSNVCTFCEI